MDFERAFKLIVGVEGGYVNDPNDPGGETKYGISKRAYPDLDIKNLELSAAESIYKKDYWEKAKCDQLPWPVNLFVFDVAVNSGPDTAIKLLQKTLDTPQDGLFGPTTRGAVSRMDKEAPIRFLANRAVQYTGIRNFDKYGRGWFKRLFAIAMEAAQWENAD